MIVVTGAAGFIGSNLVLGLNARGRTDVIAVDDLTDGTTKVLPQARCVFRRVRAIPLGGAP